MKRLLLGSIVMSIFSIAILIFQISCQKDVNAQIGTSYTLPPASATTLGGVIVGTGLMVTNNGTLSVKSTETGLAQTSKLLVFDGQNFATVNYDGTDKTVISFTLPAGRQLRSTPPRGRLSPDGQTLFFEVYEGSSGTYFIYMCAIDGANLHVVASSNNGPIDFLGAY